MRLLIAVLMMGQLIACAPQPRADYRPRPDVGIALLAAEKDRVSIYVRHSSGPVVLHLGQSWDCGDAELVYDLTLSSPGQIEFARFPYESFSESLDVFHDGRIVLVPLPETGAAIGVFVNLLSGSRYFFAPSVTSPRAQAKIRSLSGRWPDVTVIVPDDPRVHERLPEFPEFQR